MIFQDLQYHLEDYGCTIDPYDGESYWVTNCISLEVCIIEDLPVYSVPTLCHYFYELGIPAPKELRKFYDIYVGLRESEIPAFVAKSEEGNA